MPFLTKFGKIRERNVEKYFQLNKEKQKTRLQEC